MEILIEPAEHSTISSHQELAISASPHDHNMMDHDMTDASCMSFQCHAIAMFSMDDLITRETPPQNHEMLSYSLDSTFLEGQKRPPRHV